MKRIGIIYLILIVLITGCAVEYQVPGLGGLYMKVASSSDLNKNPVIVIPGILGSKLVD
ncbi:MAG TPA: hypothetical protein VHT73_10560 [Thermodesulfobacteriota bacterium]|nr:hypothetical protein [Thermodesulfobacteriota bacterium]